MKRVRIGIIGCGAIGSGIAQFIRKKMKKKALVAVLSDIDPKKASDLSKKIKPTPVITNIEKLIRKSDFIVESAGMHVSAEIAEKCVSRGKSVLVMSTGGLLGRANLFKKAKAKGCDIHVPSGAVCGLDGLAAASVGRIKKVRLTTRKPPRGLKGAPGLKDIGKTKKEKIVFSGTAKEAVKIFPKNINVAATLSMNGLGAEKTKVRIITSSEYKKNTHEIEIEGDFGKIFTRTENVPSKENPKTSQLAIFSAMAKLTEVI